MATSITPSPSYSPIRNRARILFHLLYGASACVILFGLLIAFTLFVLVAFVKGHLRNGLIIFKLFLLLAIPAWALVRLAARMASYRQPPVEGTPLHREQAPQLFEALDSMRKALRGPRISHVLLINQVNAFAVSRPWSGFWFVPFRSRYIGVGVPLLQSLSPDEALSVIAHEYGHLAGHPTRFDAFVYRMRGHLYRLHADLSTWTDRGSKFLAPRVRRYIERFFLMSFAICRDGEYAADRASARLVGAATAASALVRLHMIDGHLQRTYWTQIWERAAAEPTPHAIRPWSDYATFLRPRLEQHVSTDVLRNVLDVETDDSNTHPALSDRLRSLGVEPEQYRTHKLAITPVADQTAAEAWFGERIAQVLAPFDREWQQAVDENWQKRHREIVETAARRAELERREHEDASSLNADEAWELFQIRLDADEIARPGEASLAFGAKYPDHAASRFFWGRMHLNSHATEARFMLREAALLDPSCARAVAQLIAHGYARTGDDDTPSRAELYLMMDVALALEMP